MSWLAEIASGIGIGASGGAVAAAIYAGAVAVDKEAKVEAKRDIAAFLKGFARGFEISLLARHISHIFEIIFGNRQLSFKCVARSILATMLFFLTAFMITYTRRYDLLNTILFKANPMAALIFNSLGKFIVLLITFTVSSFIFSIIPDYISLWKSRALLRLVSRSRSLIRIFCIVLVDIFASTAIFIAWSGIVTILTGDLKVSRLLPDLLDTFQEIIYGYYALLGARTDNPEVILAPIFLTSTILTSVWTLGVFVSAIIVRGAITLRYPLKLLTWLFDVNEHPIRIIGIVMAVLAWSGVILYGML